MTQSSNFCNKLIQFERNSSSISEEHVHSITSAAALSLQSFVDDIPFEFNPKYRTIVVPNSIIPEYDTTKIRSILGVPIDFTLENKVLLEALEDLKRKKKELEENKSNQSSSMLTVVVPNCSISGSPMLPANVSTENTPFSTPFVPSPPLMTLSSAQPSISSPVSVNTLPVQPTPTGNFLPQLPSPRSMPASTTTNNPSISTSYPLPSVRDIYWPTGNQQQYFVPTAGSSAFTSNSFNIPTPIRSTASPTALIKPNNQSYDNCDSASTANDLAATFDGTLGSDDPFHEAELKSLNDVAELRHLYSNIGSANTVRR